MASSTGSDRANFYVHRILPPRFAGSPRELFGEIRARLHEGRTREHWRELVALLDAATSLDWLEQQVVPYVEHALEGWEDERRELPPHWALQIISGKPHPKHRLALMGRGYPLVWPFDEEVWRAEPVFGGVWGGVGVTREPRRVKQGGLGSSKRSPRICTNHVVITT